MDHYIILHSLDYFKKKIWEMRDILTYVPVLSLAPLLHTYYYSYHLA